MGVSCSYGHLASFFMSKLCLIACYNYVAMVVLLLSLYDWPFLKCIARMHGQTVGHFQNNKLEFVAKQCQL